MFDRIIDKIAEAKIKRYRKTAKLTPKGACIKRYINDLLAGKNVYISEYEKVIDRAVDRFCTTVGEDITREEVLYALSEELSYYEIED